MAKKAKVGKNRQDKFYQLAKEQGFRSRAAFKLVQLNKRHDFLSGASRGVLDLCAAPGGWMQIARKHMPLHAPCIGIDLVPIRPVAGCSNIIGDITVDSTRSELARSLREAGTGEKVDVVLNDGSPNMGKAWLQDAYTQSELTLAALKLASEFLAAGGVFVTKVFRSNDYNSLLFVMHQLFSRVTATKPSASRAESAEIYVMCIGFKAPKSIDLRLLNPKYVFKDMSAGPVSASNSEKPDLFLNTVLKDMKKQKRNRGGYKDNEFTMFHKVSILEFCETPRPVALMVEVSQFSFEPRLMVDLGLSETEAKRAAKFLENMPETTSELLSCCEDLKVIARREFKLLLKWRSFARAKLHSASLQIPTTTEGDQSTDIVTGGEPVDAPAEGDAHSAGEGSVQEEEDLDEEVQKARTEVLAAEKRKKRKASKARTAIQRKIDMKIILPDEDDSAANDMPDSLFSLRTAKRLEKTGAALTDVLIDGAVPLAEEGYDADEEMQDEGPGKRFPTTLQEADAATRAAEEEAEGTLDQWYKVYLSHKKKDKNGILLKESKERKRLTKRRSLREALQKRVENGGDDGKEDLEEDDAPKMKVSDGESSTDEDVESDEFGIENTDANSREAALWFSQPMFEGMNDVSSDEESSSGDDENMVDVDDGEDFHRAAEIEAEKMAQDKKKKAEADGRDFDIVAAEKPAEVGADGKDDGEDSDSSFHSSDYDTDEKAEMVAISTRMRESKREGQELLDEAYHRYTFDDPLDLPRWFADQDGAYRQRQTPVTKEHVEEMKAYIKSLQAAPTKKEAEAKARRRARVAKNVEAMKTKANSIAEQGDVSVGSRMRAIEDLYKQAMKRGSSGGKKNKKKVYQVLKPGGRLTVGKNIGKGRKALRGARTTLVDRRLKADKRAAKAKATSKGGKGSSSKGKSR